MDDYINIEINPWLKLLGKSKIVALEKEGIRVAAITPMRADHAVAILPASTINTKIQIGQQGYLVYRSGHSFGRLELWPFHTTALLEHEGQLNTEILKRIGL